MNSAIPSRDETDLDRLFSQARSYELLSRDEERDIDERKWSAIRKLLELLLQDAFSRDYLARWAGSCSEPLPSIESFQRREQRSLLRRELTDCLPGGNNANQMADLADKFATACPDDELLEALLALSLPSSLVVGVAEAVMHHHAAIPLSKVAAAVVAWEHYWPPASAAGARAPSPATVTALSEQVDRYTAARDLLIMHNLRLVYTLAGRNRNKGATFLDLVQEGNLGLLRAAEKFQFKRGYRFSTYAFNWIKQGVQRHLADSAGTIRYPSHVQEQLGRVHGERGRTLARTGKTPVDTELASSLGLPVDKTRELLQLRNFGISLDAPRFEEDQGDTLLDSIAGGPFANPGDESEQASLHNRLLRELRVLDQAERQVVIRRWGLHQGPALTRAEIADQMSVSREWVRQLEQSALGKLGKSATMHAVYKDHCLGGS